MGIDIKKIVFLFLIVVLSSLVYGVECGSVPTDGCVVTEDTIFNIDTYHLPNGIKIEADNVVLDCDDAVLVGGGSGSAIYINNKFDITIKNCNISSYRYGMDISDSEKIKIEGNTLHSINSLEMGGWPGKGVALYLLNSLDINISLNTIYGVKGYDQNTWRRPGGEGIGIYAIDSENFFINRNNMFHISGGKGGKATSTFSAQGGGRGLGIYIIDSQNMIISDNNITDIAGGEGGRGDSGGPGSSGGLSSAIYLTNSRGFQIFSNSIFDIKGGDAGSYGGNAGFSYGVYSQNLNNSIIGINKISNIDSGKGNFDNRVSIGAGLGLFDSFHNILTFNNITRINGDDDGPYRDSGIGIYLRNSDFNNIKYNRLFDFDISSGNLGGKAIYLFNSNENILYFNVITNIKGPGRYFAYDGEDAIGMEIVSSIANVIDSNIIQQIKGGSIEIGGSWQGNAYGIKVFSSNRTKITNNLIDNLRGRSPSGVYVRQSKNNEIDQNNISFSLKGIGLGENNQGNGILLEDGINNTIVYNQVHFNEIGLSVLAYSKDNHIEFNNILNNSNYALANFQSLPFKAENNWWGFIDELYIQSKIYDCQDNPSMGCVDFVPYLLGPANYMSDCSDGVKNGDEMGIDCGGSCSNQNCCKNGYWDENLGEEEIDCGGSCYYSCVVPVMLVQGFLSDPEIDWAVIKSWLEGDGYIVDAIDLTIQTGFASGDIKEYAKWLRTRIRYEKTANRAEKVDVIGYDMGGLVARWYVNVLDGADVRNIYLIGTPNHGTEYFWVDKGIFFILDNLAAKLGFPGKLIVDMIKHIRGEASKQMMPHSDFLNELNYGNPKKDYGTDYLAQIEGYLNIAGDKSAIVHNYLGEEVQNNFLKKPHDNFVTVKSVRLDNVGLSIYHLNHSELTKSQEVYNQIKNALSSAIIHVHESPISAAPEPETDFHMAPLISGDIDIEDKIYYVDIDNSVIEAQFILGHFIANISLSLTMPDGFIINPETISGDSNNAFIDSMFLTGYHIDNPLDGKWKINISLKDFEEEKINFSLYIFLKTDISLDVNISKYHYDLNEQINLTAELKDGSDYVSGVNVTAKIKKPDETIENLSLYDDGTHNDLIADDGGYNNVYTDTDIYGRYDISVIANGNNFSREKFVSLWIEDYPDLIVKDISFLDSSLFVGDNITINALIENIGEKEALNATIEFYHSTEYGDRFIGEENISVGIGEIKEVSVDWMNLSLENYNVTVLISPFNSFLEKNYSNNFANKSIMVLESPERIYLNEGWNLFSLMVNSTGIDQNISLKKGWNLFGYSNSESFEWFQALVDDGTMTVPLLDAHFFWWLQSTAYYYESGIYKFVPGNTFLLRDGNGYWLYSFQDLTLILRGAGGVLNESFYWMNLTVDNGTVVKSLNDAQTLEWLQATIYYFDEDTQYYKFVPGDDDYVYPWRGYWLYSNKNLSLIVG